MREAFNSTPKYLDGIGNPYYDPLVSQIYSVTVYYSKYKQNPLILKHSFWILNISKPKSIVSSVSIKEYVAILRKKQLKDI